MTRVEDLIAELAPNGIPVATLGDIAELVRGNGMPKTDLTDEGVGAIHYGQIYTRYGAWTDNTVSHVNPETAARLTKVDPGDIIITNTSENVEDVGKAVAWLGKTQIVTGGHATVIKHRQDPRYLSYWFQSPSFFLQKKALASGTKVIDVSARQLAKVRVPVPPMEVQRSIAAILDNMTRLDGELGAELGMELEARRRQYEHYREWLLTFPGQEAVRWITMGEAGVFTRGRRFTKSDVVSDGLASIHYGEIYTHYGTSTTETVSRVRSELGASLRFARTGDVVIAAVGETVDDVCKAVAWLGEEDVAVHDDCFIFSHSMNPKFVSYYMQTNAFRAEKAKHVARAKVKRVSGQSLARLRLPVPPHDEQERVVAILDKLDALVRELSISLPSELGARRKQYEHYRDRLLTFSEAA